MDYKTFSDLTFETDNESIVDSLLSKIIGRGPIKRATITFNNNKTISVVENSSLLRRYEIMASDNLDIIETDSDDDITAIMILLQRSHINQFKKPKKFNYNN